MDYSKLVVVVSGSVSFFAQSFKENLTKSDHSNCSHQVQLTAFRCIKSMLSQKERVESEVLAWRRALYRKEKNATMEKAHRKELLGSAFLLENNAGNIHQFSSIITINPTASRIKETKDAYVLICNKLQYLLIT